MSMDIARNITTARELLEAGDIGPCELVRGRLRVMTPAGYEHGLVAMKIGFLLMTYVSRHSLGSISSSETGFLIGSDPDTVRVPDVGYVEFGRKQSTVHFFRGAPDLAVEVVSPHDRATEVEEKVQDWLAAGTRLVWVADPASRTIVAHRAGSNPRSHRVGDSVPGEDVVPGFELRVSDAFDV